MRCRAALAGTLALLSAETAGAQLGPEGTPIRTHDYSIDLFQGPVLASSRVTGLAGAYVAIAEGVDGNPHNPAAPAIRVPWSFNHFDYDLGLSFSLPTVLPKTDFFNRGSDSEERGRSEDQRLLFWNAAANLQFGSWGFGFTADAQRYGLDGSLSRDDDRADEQLSGDFVRLHLLLAKSFNDGQLIVGGGVRWVALSIVDTSGATDRQLFATAGAGLALGALWRPNGQPFRIGAALQTAVTTRADQGQAEVLYEGTANELWLPTRVSLPWELNVGAAVQLGPRPANLRWIDPSSLLAPLRERLERREDARQSRRELALARARAEGRDLDTAGAAIDAELDSERALDEVRLQLETERVDRALRKRVRELARQYVLLSSSLVLSGPVRDAVGLESFLLRQVERSGEVLVVSPRLGVESEVIPHWLKLRGGAYVEPTRFTRSSASPRVHGTFGFEVKLLRWNVFGLFGDETDWRISTAFDASSRYLSGGLSIGNWH